MERITVDNLIDFTKNVSKRIAEDIQSILASAASEAQ